MSGPLPAYLLPIALPASRAYRLAIAVRNWWYDNPKHTGAIALPVISVGNITTGGTGKTPFVRMLAKRLQAKGHYPAIVMRGYGSRPGMISDEQAEYADLLPNVPVLASPNRLSAMAAHLPRHPEVDCVLLDDGFQHRQVARDLDLVLIDGRQSRLDEHVLPAGYLREPAKNLARANAVIITRVSEPDPMLAQRIEQLHGKPPIAWCAHAWTALDLFTGDGGREEPIEWLQGKRVATMLGIGNPHAMRSQLSDAGARIMHDEFVRDHQRYTEKQLESLRNRSAGGEFDALVVTRKDWVKLREVFREHPWPTPIAVPRLEIEVLEGEDALMQLVWNTLKRE